MLPVTEKVFRRIIRMYIGGTRGGPVRLRILTLLSKPRTTQELSDSLSLDYKTVEYHLRVLEKSGLVNSSGKKYNNTYSRSVIMRTHNRVLEEFKATKAVKVVNKLNNGGKNIS
jgi:DNA-binding transcriptional ArsR family regulator